MISQLLKHLSCNHNKLNVFFRSVFLHLFVTSTRLFVVWSLVCVQWKFVTWHKLMWRYVSLRYLLINAINTVYDARNISTGFECRGDQNENKNTLHIFRYRTDSHSNENKIALFPLSYSVTNHSYFGFHSDVILTADHWWRWWSVLTVFLLAKKITESLCQLEMVSQKRKTTRNKQETTYFRDVSSVISAKDTSWKFDHRPSCLGSIVSCLSCDKR